MDTTIAFERNDFVANLAAGNSLVDGLTLRAFVVVAEPPGPAHQGDRATLRQMVAAVAHVLAGRIALQIETPHESTTKPASNDHAPYTATTQAHLAGLTPRQIDVYRAAARGLPNKLIARELDITEATVKTHLTAVYGVLGLRNRTEAAIHASRAAQPAS